MGRSGLVGPAAGVAAFAATAGLVFDAGGFHAVSWNRALVLLAVAALGLLLLAPVERPGRPVLATAGALGLLTAWTAASWLWSLAPPAALDEAQRVAVYFAAAAVVAVAGRRAPLPWLAGGVAAGIVPASCWNLALRLAPDWAGRPRSNADIGSLADPVGYANGLALLDVVAIVLLLGFAVAGRPRRLRPLAAALLVPVAADLAPLQSSGALAALAAALLVYLLAVGGQDAWRAALLVVLPALGAAAVARESAVVSPKSWDLLAAAGPGHRLLAGLAALTAAQLGLAALAPSRLPALPLLSRRLVVFAAAGLLVAAAASPQRPSRCAATTGSTTGGSPEREIAAHPLLGGGAGTYVDWWVRTRDVALSTREAHSLYLETLAELGPLGLFLLGVALGAPLLAAVRLRRTPWGPPVLAALVAYDVHAAVDFDWELAGVTLPVVLLGAGAAVAASPRAVALAPRVRAAATLAAAALAAAGMLAFAGSSALARAGDSAAAGRVRGCRRERPARAPLRAVVGGGVARDRAGAPGARGPRRRAGRRSARRSTSIRRTGRRGRELADASAGEPRRAALAEAARLNPLWASG